jgi:iron complex outermembrane receptor protein
VNTLDLTRAFEVDAGSLQVSWGAQHHREYYEVAEGDPASYAAGEFVFPEGHPRQGQSPAPAAQGNHGITPEDASKGRRDSVAVYAELGWSPSADLYLGAAGRYEHYDDTAGDTLVGKLAARYALSDSVAVRATASTGFRAPPLAQQQYASSTSQFRDLDGDGVQELLLIKQLPPDSPAAVALGAVPLEPEESVGISAGLTFEALGSLVLTLDAYHIDLDDRIAITSTLSGPEVTAILVANGLSSSLSGQYYTNAIDTTTTGLDVVATYALELGEAGSLSFNLGYNTNDTDIDRIADNPPELEALGPDFVLFDRSRQGNLTYGFPQDKTVLGINWTWNKLNVGTRIVRFGEYRSVNNNPAAEHDIPAETIVDLDVRYQFTNLISASVGGNNVFNEYPAQIREPSVTGGSGFYDTSGGYGFTGGSWYARLELTF